MTPTPQKYVFFKLGPKSRITVEWKTVFAEDGWGRPTRTPLTEVRLLVDGKTAQVFTLPYAYYTGMYPESVQEALDALNELFPPRHIMPHREIRAEDLKINGTSPYPISRLVGTEWLNPDGTVELMNVYTDTGENNGPD